MGCEIMGLFCTYPDLSIENTIIFKDTRDAQNMANEQC